MADHGGFTRIPKRGSLILVLKKRLLVLTLVPVTVPVHGKPCCELAELEVRLTPFDVATLCCADIQNAILGSGFKSNEIHKAINVEEQNST